ncbi:MAG: LamG domain-containing protein [Verrucomicrobiae bacterium]|nr:LamG domain-containing protein [Verrucomicrobiae bacterium]
MTNATFEVWVTWNGGPVWQRILDFGNSTAGEDVPDWQSQTIFLTPNNGSALQLCIYPYGARNKGLGESETLDAEILGTGTMHHIVWTYDAVTSKGQLFRDGVLVAVDKMIYTLAELGDTSNNWLGRSQYSWDPFFNGSIQEFRIYDGPILAAQVAANYQNGPDVLQSPVPALWVSLEEGVVELSWQSSEEGFVVESVAQLGTGEEWSAETAPVTSNGNRRSIRIEPEGTQRFYRLGR